MLPVTSFGSASGGLWDIRQPVVGTPAVPAAGSAMSPMRALYSEWRRAKDAYNEVPDDDDSDRLYERVIEVERRAVDFAPHTAEDWAFKIIFADDEGDMETNWTQPPLVKMAYDTVGIAPRHWRSWEEIKRGG